MIVESKARLAQKNERKANLNKEKSLNKEKEEERSSLEKSIPSIATSSRSRSNLNEPIRIPAYEKTKFLIPNATLTPLPVTPRLARSIIGGAEIVFDTAPALLFKLGEIKFCVSLNGSNVASCVIQGVQLQETCTMCRVSLEVEPCVISSRPVSGFASAAKGILKGAISGTLNGLLYGEWGAGSTIMGICDLTVSNEQGKQVNWLSDILSSIPLEYDIDAVKKGVALTSKATGDFKDGMLRVAASVYDGAGRQSRCNVM